MERQLAPPYRFSDPRHERIYRRLLLIGPGPAAFFRDACRLREGGDQGLESVAHLVAHLLREIESAIRDVLEPLPIPVDVPEFTDDVRQLRSVALEAFGCMGLSEEHPVYLEVMRRLTSSHKANIKAVLNVLEIDEASQLGQNWLKLTQRSYKLSGKAHRSALNPPRPFDAHYRDYLLLVDSVFDGILEAFEHQYFVGFFHTLDELLHHPQPTAANLNDLRDRVPHNWVTLGYFFDRLSHPAWLEPLRARSFFANPPAPERLLDDDGVRFPRWPQSQCLARMARSGANPELIADIIRTIPETENPRIQSDLIEAIRWLPVDVAVTFLPRIERWIETAERTGLSQFMSEHLGSFIVVLAQGGHAHEALHLSETVLSVRPLEPALTAETAQGETVPIYVTPGRPGMRVDEHDYEDIVREITPALIAADSAAAFSMLCRLLGEAIVAATAPKELTPPEDYLDIWRPAIEHQASPRSGIGGVRDVLISAVRDAGEEYCRPNPPARLPEALTILRAHQWRVFQWLECHLMRTFAQSAPAHMWEVLSNRSMFDRDVPPHEYQRLMHDVFGHLTPDQRATILSWIEAGPDREAFEAREVHRTDAPPSPEEIARHTRLWQWRHLRPIRDGLPDPWRARLDQLDAEFHDPAYPEPEDGFSLVDVVWEGPTSPLSADELAAMEIGEIIECIASWEPSGERRAPDREGFARALGDVVKESPARFAAAAMAFAPTGPAFVGWLLIALGEALKGGTPFPWPEVLRLCRVAAEPDEEPLAADAEDDGSNKAWMRRQVCHLLQEGFVERPGEIPFYLREAAWVPLSMLHTDPDSTHDREERFLIGIHSLFELAIHTVRGAALEAVIGYALWVTRHGESQHEVRGHFSDVPKVQEVLNRHLDPTREPSLAIRSIYGSWLNQLVYLDPEWVQRALPRLFPAKRERRDAVWQTFLVWGRVDLETFTLLRDQYRWALDHLEKGEESETQQERPDLHGLAEHLLVLFWWGEIDLDEPDRLLPAFFERAPADARAHGISFLGRSLAHNEGQPDEMVVQRLQQLWDWRIESCPPEPNAAALTELQEFGWWFSSGKLDTAFSISRLRRVLELTKQAKPSSKVARELVRMCESFPVQVVTCVDLMLDGVGVDQGYIEWLDEAEEILARILASDDAEATVAARRVVNRLVARGFVHFRKLVQQGS